MASLLRASGRLNHEGLEYKIQGNILVSAGPFSTSVFSTGQHHQGLTT